jgi:hypothetical protein
MRKKFLSGGQAKLDKDGDGKITGKTKATKPTLWPKKLQDLNF